MFRVLGVYCVLCVQSKFHDQDQYSDLFFLLFEKFAGTVIAADRLSCTTRSLWQTRQLTLDITSNK